MSSLMREQVRPVDKGSVGPLLAQWRKTRSMSQLDLALEANVSPRHVCFIETGRAKPSRSMILQLADALTVPLRERNALLLAAGFAPMFRESRLDAPQLASVRAALDAILKQQEPFPAVVMNRSWDIVGTNEAANRFFELMLDGRKPEGPPNVLRLMFDPLGLRPSVTNWEDVARSLIRRLHREAVEGVIEPKGNELLAELLRFPGVPAHWNAVGIGETSLPIIPVCFRSDRQDFRFFSTVTVLGTPQDITLQEIRIECFFPADDATRLAAIRLAKSGSRSTVPRNRPPRA
jgi:transcriptional regulator with XRE-family HTH domain